MGDEGLPSICRDIDDQCLQCPVCFGRYVRPKVLPSCGHIVCEDCLKGCLSGRSLKCPLCRKENFPNMQGNDVSTLPDSHVTKSLLDMVEKREGRQVGPANTTRERNTQMQGPRDGSNRRMAGYQTPDDTRSTRYNDTGGFAPVDVTEDRRRSVNSFTDQHTCPICGFSFPDLDTLEVHTMMCEPDPSNATTPSVSQAQINGGGRRAVPTTHRIASAANSCPNDGVPSIDEYVCPRCERPFPDLKTLQSHVDECIPDDTAFRQSPRRYNRHCSQRFSGRRDQRPRSAGRGPKPSRHYVPSAIHTNPSRANGGGRSSMERSVYSDREGDSSRTNPVETSSNESARVGSHGGHTDTKTTTTKSEDAESQFTCALCKATYGNPIVLVMHAASCKGQPRERDSGKEGAATGQTGKTGWQAVGEMLVALANTEPTDEDPASDTVDDAETPGDNSDSLHICENCGRIFPDDSVLSSHQEECHGPECILM